MTIPTWWNDPTKRKKALELKLGLIKRPQPDVPHIPAGSWADVELGKFQTWVLWWAEGHLKPRPPALNNWFPKKDWGYWDVLTEYIAKNHQLPKPPTPPAHNPPSIWAGHPNVPWYVKRVDISHGLRTDNGVWDISTLIDRLHASGTKAVTFQFGADCPDPDWATHGPALYKAAKSEGLICGVWGRCDYRPWEDVKRDLHAAFAAGCDGLLADVEGPCEDPELPEHLAAEFPEIPMGVIATGAIDDAFKPNDPIGSAIRFGDRFDFVGQDYHKTENPLTSDMAENFVWWRSTDKNNGKGYRHLPDLGGRWHSSTLMAYAETCPPLSDYHQWTNGWPALGHWDGEILEGNGAWGEWATF